MSDLHKERQQLETETDLFRFVRRDAPCMILEQTFGSSLKGHEPLGDLDLRHDDIEALALMPEGDDWRLDVQVKYRDEAGKLARAWVSAYRLKLDAMASQFYQYVLPHLGDFSEAKIPGGTRRTTLEKLKAAHIPQYRGEDLTALTASYVQLDETLQTIQRTDHLIDQIVYRLYGLTADEIAIVEGR